MSVTSVANLTTMEVDALTDPDGGLNLTDGHARLAPSPTQAEIIAQIPRMFATASRLSFAVIEEQAQQVFLSALGQHSAPLGTGRILSCYSSTLATDIVARSLTAGSTVAVLHPTFDNIADLLRTRGLRLIPLEEGAVLRGEWPSADAQTIFITLPNNPTGMIVSEPQLASLAEHAAALGQTIVIDASFRGQVAQAHYDTYAVLDAAGVDWIVIEDTGKLWPTHELKIGFLAFSERFRVPIKRAFSESLLSASPVVLLLVTALARDWADGGRQRAAEVIETNRRALRDAIGTVGLHVADPLSQISVARILLPTNGPDAATLYDRLLAEGVHVLPCAPFHWADPASGRHFLRLALSRPTDAIVTAAQRLAGVYHELIETPRSRQFI